MAQIQRRFFALVRYESKPKKDSTSLNTLAANLLLFSPANKDLARHTKSQFPGLGAPVHLAQSIDLVKPVNLLRIFMQQKASVNDGDCQSNFYHPKVIG